MQVDNPKIPKDNQSPATLYRELTGLVCRVPWSALCPDTPWLSQPWPLCRFWVRCRYIPPEFVFKASWRRPLRPLADVPCRFSRFPIVMILERLISVSRGESPRRRSLPCPNSGFNVTVYYLRTGLLTGFPFENCKLWVFLGSADPRPTGVAAETWPFRRSRFSLL